MHIGRAIKLLYDLLVVFSGSLGLEGTNLWCLFSDPDVGKQALH